MAKAFKIGKVRDNYYNDITSRLSLYVTNNPIITKKLKDLTGCEIQDLLNGIKAPRQREHIYGYLKDCLGKAYKLNFIKKDLFAVITLPKRKRKKVIV